MKRLIFAGLAGGALLCAPALAQTAITPPVKAPLCAGGQHIDGKCDVLEPEEALLFDGRGGAFYEEAEDVTMADEPASAFFPGQLLPEDLDTTVIRFPSTRNLAQPQTGYYYVDAGGQILLIQAATHTIVQTY